jgi:signal transduction histidine kinase
LIAVALIILLAAPFSTNARLSTLRGHVAGVLSPALVRANILEAALATEFAARRELAADERYSIEAATAAAGAKASIVQNERILDSLVRGVSPDAVARFTEARASIAIWRREEDTFAAMRRSTRAGAPGGESAERRIQRWDAVALALANLQRLEDEVTITTMAEHAQIDRLERISLLLTVWLVPIALLALLALAWTARRTLQLTQAAAIGQRNAERAMAAKSALMRGVTHDLKNPIGAARGYAELLEEEAGPPLPEPQAKMVRRILSLLSATLGTLNDLMELSQADAGELKIDRSETDVAMIARNAIDDYRASADGAGLEFRFKVEESGTNVVARVMTDPVRVREVLGNLLTNAVKYTPRGGVIQLSALAAQDPELGPVIALEVSDTGPGIPEAYRERVFEEFFRVPTADAMAHGTGVGLSIARRVARLLGGDLRVREAIGGGAVFSLLIPASRATG